MIYAWLASIGGKALAILAGVLLCMGVLAYIGHVRKENVRLTQTVARLEADAALLAASGRIALRLAGQQRDAREKLEPELEKLKHALLTRELPKLPPACDRKLDLQRDALEWLQHGWASGRLAESQSRRQADPDKLSGDAGKGDGGTGIGGLFRRAWRGGK